MGGKKEKPKGHLLVKLRRIMKKGDKKSSTFAAEEALKFYKRSLDSLEKQAETEETRAEKIEIKLLLSEILFILGRWDSAISYLAQIQSMPLERAGPSKVAEAYRRSGNLWALKGDIDRSFEDYTRALNISKKIDDPVSLADSQRGLGYAYWRRGKIPEAEEHYQEAFEALRGTDEKELRAKTYLESGNVYNDKGDLDKAVDYYMKAIRVFRKTKDVYQEARGYNNLGDVCIKRKDWKKGIRYFEKTAYLADSINDLHMQGWALFNAAECHSKAGDLEKAEECCTKALDMLSRIDDKIGIAYVFCNYGIVYRFKKEWAKSIKYFKFSLNIVKNIKAAGLEAYILKEYAQMQDDRGKKDKATELALRARDIYLEMGATFYVDMTNEILAAIEGRKYKMDVSLSDSSLEAVEKESEAPEPESTPRVQAPVVVESGKRSTLSGESTGSSTGDTESARGEPGRTVAAMGDDAPQIVREGGTSRIDPSSAPPDLEKGDAPEVAGKARVEPEEPKLYLVMPRQDDEALRRRKVRFYVELPFVAPEVDVEEVSIGDDIPALEEKIEEAPAVVLFGRVYSGIPEVRELADDIKAWRMRSGDRTHVSGGTEREGDEDTVIPVPSAGSASAVDRTPGTISGEGKLAKFHYGYLLEDENHERAISYLKDLMEEGAEPLIVTRPPARKIEERFGLEDVDLLLLSSSERKREGLIPMSDIEELTHLIEDFMEKHDRTVVLLDRAEVIADIGGFDRLLKMIHSLNECVEICESCLLIPLDPKLIGSMELRTLRRELSPL